MARMIGALHSVTGLGLLWVGYLSATERLPRNGLVGMRTRATMASDDAWFAAHRAGAWSLLIAGLILFGVGVWLVFVGPSDATTTAAAMSSAVLIIVVVVIGGLQADRVARGTSE
ncbi:MAG TPA: SdpI family protein [Acidimicrobiales bacterium]|nr:SdpI family protein [Acidimicrobiales bacterium]